MTQFPNNVSNPFVESSMREWRESKYKMQLIGSKCGNCGTCSFPRRNICSKCHSNELKDYKFNKQGKILNYTREGVPQISVMGFEKKIPRVIGMIELEKKVVVVGEIIETEDLKSISVGDKVTTVLRKMPRLSNGMDNYAFKFKKIEESNNKTSKEFTFDYSMR
ncbi:hypothetical protein J6TS1_43020 [Siminovitchia terrae]|uniref:ChsH2 rubredoxin-like zinc ribbon domain-containing protein n=1 Tax=Siminovitchia terrae TaxID=1914933 RepID=A0ABQ4L2C5_SIMTE|nr:zinc ribbon domain-containing protein [Siminovitchia terrae]GIN98432.1 hypothetical protein J6TS1_43020 [Siminovitchia terrae]